MAKKNITTIKRLLTSFKQGATIQEACKSSGISAVILWRWCKNWPNLANRIEELKRSRLPMVIDAVYINAINGKEASQKLYLEIHGVIRKTEKDQHINVNVPIDITNATHVSIPVVSPEEDEKVKSYAKLIRSHNLVSRTLGEDGRQSILGIDAQDGVGVEGSAGADS